MIREFVRKMKWAIDEPSETSLNAILAMYFAMCVSGVLVSVVFSLAFHGHPLWYSLLGPGPESFGGHLEPWWWQVVAGVVMTAATLATFNWLMPDTRREYREECVAEDEVERVGYRYAHGELGEDEFERRVERLVGDRTDDKADLDEGRELVAEKAGDGGGRR